MPENDLYNAIISHSAEAGIFTWNLGADLVFGDSAVAELFGFSLRSALEGQRMACYLDRVHPDDLSRVALEIHNAITMDGGYRCEYRVRGIGNEFRPVASFGRCFRTNNRELTQFAGIVYPIEPTPTDYDRLVKACVGAALLAEQLGRSDVALRLSEVILALDPPPPPPST
ncbi:PAS domain-containing protein [Pararhizobium sp. DWP1-1-3]|uniref:PAS domain-containing protein n=1 Tax=Pararhizobium sp. DWP1-1-3 TaxID=2804652 RepID=UPI003CEC65FF